MNCEMNESTNESTNFPKINLFGDYYENRKAILLKELIVMNKVVCKIVHLHISG